MNTLARPLQRSAQAVAACITLNIDACMQIHSQLEQLASMSILSPIEASMSDSESAPKSELAESGGRAPSVSPSKQPRGSMGAERADALFGSALLARVDDLVQKCSSSKSNIKDMRARYVLFLILSVWPMKSSDQSVVTPSICVAVTAQGRL